MIGMIDNQWFPGADLSIPAAIDGGRMDDKLALPKCVWHTTQTSGVPSYSTGYWPHMTIHGSGKVYQHIPANRAARSLRNEPGGVDTNRFNVFQIEVCGFANQVHFLPIMRDIALWLHDARGVPLETVSDWFSFPESFGPSSVRFTFQEWEAFSGHCGHMHVPENDHGDPGWPFPIAEILRSDSTDMPLNADDKAWISNQITYQLYRALLVLETGKANQVFNPNSTPGLFDSNSTDLAEVNIEMDALTK